MDSKLGWILMGKVDGSLSSNYKGGPCSFTVQTTSELDGLVRNFWEVESVPSLQDQKTREEDYETYYMKTYSRNCQGRYSVKLLFRKANHAHTSLFPDSYSSQTSQRLMPIENSMSRANSEAKISPHLGHPSIISEVNRYSPQAAHQNSSIPTSKYPIIPLGGRSGESVLHKTNLDSRRSFQETNHQAGPSSLYASRSELKFSERYTEFQANTVRIQAPTVGVIIMILRQNVHLWNGNEATLQDQKKIRSQRSAGKVLLTIFWDVDGPIGLEFLSSRQRMNSDLYCDILVNRLKPGIRNKRRGKLSKGVLFLHDNARPHTSCKTVSTIIKLSFEVLEHPAYSPDLAPSDYQHI
ncbi:hypothetical protein LAZ67_2004207 [Cordylochernes scorpioides]|uniref:Transposase n=1 Tax=Cordylochernes scorpioides TaxID=51811 RepID=A0ABY6K5A6_9ARAC|nr:hypothetical protein LAZ67_2004207 [Cordylochernes scorpioides]